MGKIVPKGVGGTVGVEVVHGGEYPAWNRFVRGQGNRL